MKNKKCPVIVLCILFALWFLIIPGVIGIILYIRNLVIDKNSKDTTAEENELADLQSDISRLRAEKAACEEEYRAALMRKEELLKEISMQKAAQQAIAKATPPKQEQPTIANKADYVVVDLETTGLKPSECEIIEIGAVKVTGNKQETFQSLVKPTYPISRAITNLTHITNDMVKDVPSIDEVLPRFLDFLGDNIIVAHNASFDLSFLSAACEKLNMPFNNKYIDTLSWARRCYPQFRHHTLECLCDELDIDNSEEHRALSDALATQKLYDILLDVREPRILSQKRKTESTSKPRLSESTKALRDLQSLLCQITEDNVLTDDEVYRLNQWLAINEDLCGNYPFDKVKQAVEAALEDGVIEQRELDEMLAIFKDVLEPTFGDVPERIDVEGKNVCLTGNFARAARSDVEVQLRQKGAVIKTGVSGKLDYLIVGSLGNAEWQQGNYGAKIKKAMELREAGSPINIVEENNFFEVLV